MVPIGTTYILRKKNVSGAYVSLCLEHEELACVYALMHMVCTSTYM